MTEQPHNELQYIIDHLEGVNNPPEEDYYELYDGRMDLGYEDD